MFLPAHYACDVCQRVLESDDERYVYRLEANDDAVASETADGQIDSDRDYLQEIDDVLERGGDIEDLPLDAEIESHDEYHLCRECWQRFVHECAVRDQARQLNCTNR
jgi:hypothetical protein